MLQKHVFACAQLCISSFACELLSRHCTLIAKVNSCVHLIATLLLRSSLIRIYTVCHSFYIFWRHYFNVKLNCFILRTTTVAGLGVPIFRVITVQLVKKIGFFKKIDDFVRRCIRKKFFDSFSGPKRKESH